jgi:tetratricopeptide (TPR) repeat protein
MEHLTAFIYYLTIFRIAIITAGITSIILGYRLFATSVFPKMYSNDPSQKEDFAAEFAGAKFSLRNATPGTCFALFGALIIVFMLVSGSPEVTIELMEKGIMKATLRGNRNEDIQSYSQYAVHKLKRGENAEALETVHKALGILAAPLNDFAWVLMKSDSNSFQTNFLAEIAVSVEPQNINFLHTLAEIQYKNGDKKKAIQTLEKAQHINPLFTEQLKRWNE